MICFCWVGFPQYAARCIRAALNSTSEKIVVIASRPDVPIQGMEELAGCDVYWVDIKDDRSLKSVLGEVPRVLTVPGWKIRLFNKYRDEVRANGGRVIVAIDNNYVLSWKEIIKSIAVRLFYRRLYDGFWVPAASGRKLMRLYGIPEAKVFMGLYSADGSLFGNGLSLAERGKRILYVGQFIDRKNVMNLCRAFLKAKDGANADWELELCGCGALKSSLPNHPSIIVHDFVQPESLSSIYKRARIFVLPSKEEHWGLVVHEAALSGCVLLLSNRVGSLDDFLEENVNGFSFSPFSVAQMVFALSKAMRMSDEQLAIAQQTSLRLGLKISTKTFADAVMKFSACK